MSVVNRQKTLKVQWFTRICTDDQTIWKKIFYSFLAHPIDSLIWKCNLSPAHSHLVLIPNTDIFWRQMFLAWCQFNFAELDSIDTPDQPIWLNSNILIDPKPFIMIKAWCAGIIFIRDLFKLDGNIKTLDEIKSEFGECMDWLQYLQLCRAIPIELRLTLDISIFNLLKYNRLLQMSKISNMIYSHFIQNDSVLEHRQLRWSRKLQVEIDNRDFLKCCKNIYCQTISTKFRDFQYRLVLCAIPTNRKLFLWKVRDSQLCSFCENDIEDEIHLFVNCTHIQSLWRRLKDYIKDSVGNHVMTLLKWSPRNIIFSQVHPAPNNVINFLVTIVKQYIYKTRCTQGMLSSDQMIRDIDHIYQIESNIAIKKDKWNKHKHKWSALKEIPDVENDYIANYIQSL